MRCLNLQFHYLPTCSKHEWLQHGKQTTFLSSHCSGGESSWIYVKNLRMQTPRSWRMKALPIPSPVVLADSSSPISTDPSSFLRVSAGLFLVYWIGNFVVPDLISKFYEFDKVNEDQKVDDVKVADDSLAEK